MKKIILYNKENGNKDVLEKYIINIKILFDACDDEFNKFKNFTSDSSGNYIIESILNVNNIFLYDDVELPLIKFNKILNIFIKNRTDLINETEKNIALFKFFYSNIVTTFLIETLIKIEYPKKYIIIGPGNFINQIIPLFIINDIKKNYTKWQIFIFEASICDEQSEFGKTTGFGCVGNYVKTYINKIDQNISKYLDIILINSNLELDNFFFLSFINKTFEKIIINDTTASFDPKHSLEKIDYNYIEKFIPNFITNYINNNHIIWYSSGSGLKKKIVYYNKISQTFETIDDDRIDLETNCKKNHNSVVNDALCPLDYYSIEMVLNNNFNELKLSSVPKKKEGFYNKYLKYKNKYLYLKNQIGGLTRSGILEIYYKNVNLFKQNYETNLALLLHSYNISYKSRPNLGMYYAIDYTRLVNDNDEINSFVGLTNDNFFNILVNKYNSDLNMVLSFFQSLDYTKPSDALKAFIIGPTFCECANAIQVTIYHHILNLVGEDKFNDLFGNLLTPFIITSEVFTPMKNLPRKLDKIGYESIFENPLYFLYDSIVTNDLILNNLQNNDIVYIQGVTKYSKKHLSGSSIGWNLICYRPNKSEEPKFIGFGPIEFNTGPKTFEEMRELLVKAYNQRPDDNTIKIIKKRKEKYTSPYDKELIMALLAEVLVNDTIPANSSIGGIKAVLRFNEEKLRNFIHKPRQKWYEEQKEYMVKLLPLPKLKPINLLLKSFSIENMDSRFNNFKQETQLQKKIFELMTNFALKVVTKTTEYGPIGFILSGSPGIGKTHLSVACAKIVSKYNKKVTFVDDAWLNYANTQDKMNDFKHLFKDSDLIIIDDINSKYSGGVIFLKQVLEYVILKSKSILYTGNQVISVIQENLPILYSYDHPFAKNFLSLNLLVDKSSRIPWTVELGIKNINELSNEKKMIALNTYKGHNSAGIIINLKISESDLITEYNRNTGNTEPIRIVRDWISEQNFQKYKNYEKNEQKLFEEGFTGNVDDLINFKIIIMNIYNYSTAEQLIRILPRLHDNSIKIIVISDFLNFKKLLDEQLLILDKSLKPRLTERLKIIFPNIFDLTSS